jgi:glycosyltransferase involved in cell wall biosynthesis
VASRGIRKAVTVWAGKEALDYRFGTLLRDSDRIIVLSDLHRATLSELFPGVDDKSVLIPPPPILLICPEDNGVARSKGREALGLSDEDFLIAYLGYVYPGKGIETLLKAVQTVSNERANVRLVVVGGTLQGFHSYAERVYELPHQMGIGDKVTWTGQYSWDSDKASTYLRAADAFVLPIEIGVQMNNSSFAAAATHGLPIITTRGADLERQFVHQENVFLCPPKDPDSMASAIKLLMDAPDLRARLRAGALRLARDWFSWERATDRTLATFGEGNELNAHTGHI